MPTSPVLKEIAKSYEMLKTLGQDQGAPMPNVRACICYLLHTPGEEPDLAQWPFPTVDFMPTDDWRENLVTAAAFLTAAIESGDREHAKDRKTIVAAQENAAARFATVRPNDEIKIKHAGNVVYHGQVGADGQIDLNGISIKAAGLTQGEVAGIILQNLGLTE